MFISPSYRPGAASLSLRTPGGQSNACDLFNLRVDPVGCPDGLGFQKLVRWLSPTTMSRSKLLPRSALTMYSPKDVSYSWSPGWYGAAEEKYVCVDATWS